MNEEIIASIKLLSALVKADGEVHENEILGLANVLESAGLPARLTVAGVLEGNVDVAAEIAKIKSPDVRKRTYEAACAIAYVDGDAAAEEKAILDAIREAFADEEADGFVDRFKKGFRQDWFPSTITRVEDPALRDAEIDGAIRRAAIRSAVFGAIPVPLAGEFLVSFVELRLVRVIGGFYGNDNDAKFWKGFIASVAGVAASRFALQSLMKLVPGWGSVAGATASFAMTWAIGKTARTYFEKGQSEDPIALRATFKAAKAEGLEVAKGAAAEIEAEKAGVLASKEELDRKLASKEISEEEYAELLVAPAK